MFRDEGKMVVGMGMRGEFPNRFMLKEILICSEGGNLRIEVC